MRIASCLQRTGCRRGTRAMPPARSCLQTRQPRATLLALCGPRSACSSRRYSPSWQSLAAICTHAVRMSACSNVAMVQSECCFEFQVCALQAMQGSAPPPEAPEVKFVPSVTIKKDPRAGPCGQLLGQRGQQQPRRCCTRGPAIACTASCRALGLGPGGCAQRPAALHRRCRRELLAGGSFRTDRTCTLHSGPSSP